MKFFTTSLLLIAFVCESFAQNIQEEAIKNTESEGILLNLYSQNFTNNFYNYSPNSSTSDTRIQIGLNAGAWRFREKLLLAGFGVINGEYLHWDANETGYEKERGFRGSAFAGGDYYISPKFYATLSGGSEFYNYTRDAEGMTVINNYFEWYRRRDHYKGSENYIWGGFGYGRILNTSSIDKQINFEKILLLQKVITSSLPLNVKTEIDKLIEKRNNKDFISKYRDNADAEFFKEIENILKRAGVIENSLDAETTIKLYNSLINKRYLYYPNYKGFQIQAEAQVELTYGRNEHFITTSGLYGLAISEKTNLLFSGFFSLPMNKTSSASGLFHNSFKNPFSNYLLIMVENLELNNQNYLNSRFYSINFGEDKQFFTGAKAILFQKFDEFAGIRGYISSVFEKPSNGRSSALSIIGSILDYNIFSFLTLNAQTELVITSRRNPDFYYNIGLLWNVL